MAYSAFPIRRLVVHGPLLQELKERLSAAPPSRPSARPRSPYLRSRPRRAELVPKAHPGGTGDPPGRRIGFSSADPKSRQPQQRRMTPPAKAIRKSSSKHLGWKISQHGVRTVQPVEDTDVFEYTRFVATQLFDRMGTTFTDYTFVWQHYWIEQLSTGCIPSGCGHQSP